MKKRLEIEDILEYRFISSLQASADKKHCLFCVHQANLQKNGYDTDLYGYDTHTDEICRLTASGTAGPGIWLNENVFLFSQKEGRENRVPGKPKTIYYKLSIDGGTPERYMEIPAEIKWISHLGDDKFALLAKAYLPDLNSPDAREADRETWYVEEGDYIVADELPFRQDGMGITNGMRYRAYIFDKKAELLTPISDAWQNIESINASDGKVIFSARRFDKESPYLFYGDVEVYDSKNGKHNVLLDDNTFRVYGVGFIKERPVFLGTQGLLHGYQNENSSLFGFDEKGKPSLLCFSDRSMFNTVGTDVKYGETTSFITCDEGVYYVGTEEGNAFLKLARVTGEIDQVSFDEGTVDDFAVLDGKILYAGLHNCSPQELYVLQAGKATKISDYNKEIVNSRRLSRPEHLTFRSGELDLDGYIIKPVEFDKKKRYPSILYIHGGHKCAFGSVYYHEMQVWANRGFFVIYCNPRGSDGRDDNFADVIGHYGFYEEEDLLAFRDACLDLYPQMDPNHMGIGGGSYGGFLTNWMIGRTDCFRCAVSQRSIASWNGMFFTSDTNYLFPCWSFETDVWMDPERYWLHSPLKYAQCCKTPTLFIHAEQDYRCPVSEGISMFNALKVNGTEARLCIFKGESHGLSRSGKPRSRIKRLKEITHWYEKYLKETNYE